MYSLVLLIVVTLTLVIGRSFAGKLKGLQKVTNDMAAGNLAKRMIVKVDDEIGRLALSFNKAINNLQDTVKSMNSLSVHNQGLSRDLSENVEQTISVITEINNGINLINDDTEHLTHNIVASKAALEQILDNNKSLADQINNQASSVEQTSASVEEMTASIKSVAKITEEKKKAADKLVSVTMTGGEKVNTTTDIVNQISRSIDDMLNLITVINNVASQTDLLSMNAAIEAAQAGDAGKGFAVVADEIGKLAESTSENALNISQTLKSVVDKIKEALTAGKESGQAFAEITAGVKEVADAFSEISLSTDELANGSREILNATNDLLKSTEEIRSDSTQMQRGSEEIRNIITEIQEISANNLIGVKSINTKSNNIYDSIDKISHLIIQNSDNAEEMQSAINKFEINGESVFDDQIDTSVLINARIRHKLWLIRVEQFLHDSHSISEEEIASAEECSLGRWLYSSGLKRFADIDEITSLEQVHKEMHEKSERLVSLSKAGEKAQAEAVLQELKSYSQAITGYLGTIEEKIALKDVAQELEAL
jgi:methyl-accepting chemotaxis protein